MDGVDGGNDVVVVDLVWCFRCATKCANSSTVFCVH